MRSGQGLWIEREPSECVGTGSWASFLSAPSPGRAVFQEELGIPHAGPGSSAAVPEQAAGCVEYCGHGFVNCLWRCSRERVRQSWTIHVVDGGWAASCRPLDVASIRVDTNQSGQGTSGAVGGYQPGDTSQEPNFPEEVPTRGGYQPEGFGLSVRSLMSMPMPVDPLTGKVDLPSSLAFGARDTSEADAYWRTPRSVGDISYSPHANSERAHIVMSLPRIAAPTLPPCTAYLCVNLRDVIEGTRLTRTEV